MSLPINITAHESELDLTPLPIPCSSFCICSHFNLELLGLAFFSNWSYMLFIGGSPSITNILQASSGKSTPSYLFINTAIPTWPLFNFSTPSFKFSIVNSKLETSDQYSALFLEGTIITTLQLFEKFNNCCLISSSVMFLFITCGIIIRRSPISLALSGEMMFGISSG